MIISNISQILDLLPQNFAKVCLDHENNFFSIHYSSIDFNSDLYLVEFPLGLVRNLKLWSSEWQVNWGLRQFVIPFHINCSRECNFIFEAYFNSLVFMEVHQCTHVPLKIEKSFDKRSMLVNGCQCLFFLLFSRLIGKIILHYSIPPTFYTIILCLDFPFINMYNLKYY